MIFAKRYPVHVFQFPIPSFRDLGSSNIPDNYTVSLIQDFLKKVTYENETTPIHRKRHLLHLIHK